MNHIFTLCQLVKCRCCSFPFIELLLINLICLFSLGCNRPLTPVALGNREQILHKGNGQEPEELDPHLVNGISESHILAALLEGLVSAHPETGLPVPGVAERWVFSKQHLVLTFYLRPEATWSNGDRVQSQDFVFSYQRMLSNKLGSSYAYMLYVLKNAEAYHNGELKDFQQVGVKALDAHTLELSFEHAVPYILSLMNHWSWYPVHPSTILKYGEADERGTIWTRPEHYVGNGPFQLESWKMNEKITVSKNPFYWDAKRVALQGIHFYPIGDSSVEERAFRAGQLHLTYQLPLHKVPRYREQKKWIRIDPYLATYFYCLNIARAPLDSVKVRRALSLAIDRQSIVEHILRGGQQPAFHFTPPDTAGYTSTFTIKTHIEEAKKLLAEAGYPEGKGFPHIELLYNSSDNHRIIAQAIQQMWKEHLAIDVLLINQEWKVYVNTRREQDFDICRFGWTGDYLDPHTFLGLWTTGSGNNASGWSNARYDQLLSESDKTQDVSLRYELLKQAEKILLEECPVIPIYFYTSVYLIQPSVKGWYPNVLDHHPYKYISLAPSS